MDRFDLSGKVAICVPTYSNNYGYIKEAIQNGMLELYKKHGIDLYLYDSSETDDIEHLVIEYQNYGYKNLFEVKLPAETYLDTKLVCLLGGLGQTRKYEYIWPCRDSTWFAESTLHEVYKVIDEKHDVIVLNPQNPQSEFYPPRINKKYNNIDVFYHEIGWYLTGMMCRLFRRETLIENADWIYIFDKYRVWIENGTFLEFGFLFEQLSRLKSFSAVLLSDKIVFNESEMKGSASHWRGKELDVWGRCFPQTIEKLPDCYTDKKSILIKKQHFNDIEVLKYLRTIGELNFKTYMELHNEWETLSIIPRWKILLIAIKPRLISAYVGKQEAQFIDCLLQRYEKKLPWIRKMVEENKKIVIYGAGFIGGKIRFQLEKNGIPVYCFAVTKQVISDNRKFGCKVVQIDSLVKEKMQLAIIIAAVPRYQKEMKETIRELGLDNTVFI